MHKSVTDGSAGRASGSVEFDDRGNARWIAPAHARTDETVIRLLDIGWMELEREETQEVRREGFVEIYRTPPRR